METRKFWLRNLPPALVSKVQSSKYTSALLIDDWLMSAQETILTKRFSEIIFFDFDYCCRKGSFPAFWNSHNSDFSYSLNHLAYFIAFQLISNSRRFTEGPDSQ